jgi:sarcosine oxidase subunit gamma
MPAVTDELRDASPLAAFAPRFAALRGVALAERALAQVILRGDPGDAGFPAAVPAPSAAACRRRPTRRQQRRTAAPCCGSAPTNGWWWRGRSRAAHAGARRLYAVDVSASRAVIELAGAQARAVLAKGCGLDLHPRSFTAGRCAQTVLARAAGDDPPGHGYARLSPVRARVVRRLSR